MELFEPVEAPFHHVSLLVDLGIEGRWSPAAGAFRRAAGDLALTFRADERDPPVSHGVAGRGMGVGLVRDHCLGPASWPAWPDPSHADAIQQRHQLRIVPSLAGSEQEPHRQATPVDGEVDLGAQPAAGAPESLPVDDEGFDLVAAAPFFRAPAEC
jgi:hypothetical protein